MNRKYYITLSALTTVLLSCSQREEIFEEHIAAQEPETIEIGFGGLAPETRAIEGDCMYAINVYLDKGKDGKYDSSDFYAKGVFSSLAGVHLTTFPGYPLKFICTIVKDAQNKISSSLVNGQLTYGLPFSASCTNKFEYSTSTTTITLGKQLTDGVSLASGVSTLEEIYYGELADFTPTIDGEKAVIPVKRMNLGYRVVVEGVQDGKASVKITGGIWGMDCSYEDISTSGLVSEDKIYHLDGYYVSWAYGQSDLWTTDLSVEFSYISNRHSITGHDWWDSSFSKTVTLKRTKMTTIRLKAPDPDRSDVGFDIILEDNEFGEDVVNIQMQVDKNDVGTVSN